MLTRFVVKLLSCMALLSVLNASANAYIVDEKKQESILSIENEIFQSAESNGLDKSNIFIIWTETASGGYIGSIKCINSNKCNKSELTITFTNQEMQTILSSHLQKQLLRNKLNSLFNSSAR